MLDGILALRELIDPQPFPDGAKLMWERVAYAYFGISKTAFHLARMNLGIRKYDGGYAITPEIEQALRAKYGGKNGKPVSTTPSCP